THLTVTVGAATLTYGNFIQAVTNFLIIALAVFLLVRSINQIQTRFEQEKEVAAAKPPEPSAEEKLLTEIRDLLREK
ncbi:MAG: MscL family protein, partial [Chloroflexota bacterium]